MRMLHLVRPSPRLNQLALSLFTMPLRLPVRRLLRPVSLLTGKVVILTMELQPSSSHRQGYSANNSMIYATGLSWVQSVSALTSYSMLRRG
jgi:hypothetical protein